MRISAKQAAFLAAKIIFAVAVITWLFHKIDAHRVWLGVRDAHRLPIFFGLLLWLVTIVIAGWRWFRLLGIFDIKIPLRSLITVVPIAQFFSMFLPGSAGDDLTRMLYISRLAPGRVGEACATVLLDRFIGLTSVLVLALFCVPWQWSLLSTSRQIYWIAVVILLARPGHSLRDEVARIWGLLCNNKMLVATIISAALVTQLVHCVIFYLAGVSVGIQSPLLPWLTFVPIVLAANALPITIAGIGIREYLLVLFLGVITHVDGAHAVATSFVILSLILMICLLGGLLYIFYRPKRKLESSAETGAPA